MGSANRRTDSCSTGLRCKSLRFRRRRLFRILIRSQNFDAEYGTYAGGQINVITKSGQNQFHGSAFEFLRNQDFDAKNFFSATRDEHKQNEFGGTIGGPIKRDKLFFFGDYQGNRVILGQSGSTGQIAVPSA